MSKTKPKSYQAIRGSLRICTVSSGNVYEDLDLSDFETTFNASALKIDLVKKIRRFLKDHPAQAKEMASFLQVSRTKLPEILASLTATGKPYRQRIRITAALNLT